MAGSIVFPLKSNFMTLVSFALTLTFTISFSLICVVLYKTCLMRPLVVIGVTIVSLALMTVGRSGRENKSERHLVVLIISSRELSYWLEFRAQSWRSQKIKQTIEKLKSWQSVFIKEKLYFCQSTWEPAKNITFFQYFSSRNSKIWVSIQNTLSINCHFFNFEGLWRGFQWINCYFNWTNGLKMIISSTNIIDFIRYLKM